MRQTWQEIQETYPDLWVLMKDPEFVRGDLKSASVLYACKEREGIFKFENENPEKLSRVNATSYTGEPIDVDVLSNDDFSISLDEPEVCLDYA
jgi:hypothetical protein